MATRADVLIEIPYFTRDGERRPRPDFRDFHRIVSVCKLTAQDLDFLKKEIIARKEAHGIKEPGKGKHWTDPTFFYGP